MEDYGIAVQAAKRFSTNSSVYDTEDLIQVAAIGIITARSKFDETMGTFATFAHKAAKNAIIDYLRMESRKRQVAWQKEEQYDPVNLNEYVSDKWTDAEIKIAQMRVAGHSMQEISDELGCSLATTNTKMRKIKDRIKKQIG